MRKKWKDRLGIALTIVAIALMIAPLSGAAQNFNSAYQRLVQVNSIKPLQNPRYQESHEIIGRRLVDSKNKVVGEVYDIIMNDRGGIESLYADFNRLQLRQKVYLNYGAMRIRPAQQSYRINYDADQITALYPEILAQTMTAAGDDGITTVSLQDMVGKVLHTEEGTTIARIKTVLFAYDGARAEAVYVDMRQKNMRGERLAVPFSALHFVTDEAGQVRVVIKPEYEAAIAQYLEG